MEYSNILNNRLKLSNTEKLFVQEMNAKYEQDMQLFHSFQEKAVNTLVEFHNICKKNKIKYYLAYGSLLGMVRDRGQIPWDYDIDVWVDYADAQRLMDALDNELTDSYYVTRLENPNCGHYILRVCPNGFNHEVLHVDVFWLVGKPKEPIENIAKRMKKMRMIMQYKYGSLREKRGDGILRSIEKKLKKTLAKIIPDKLYDDIFAKILCNRVSENLEVTDIACEYIMKREWFSEIVVMQTVDGLEFCLPNGYKEILTSLYGNYLEYMPIEKRIEEFENSLERLKKYGKSVQ